MEFGVSGLYVIIGYEGLGIPECGWGQQGKLLEGRGGKWLWKGALVRLERSDFRSIIITSDLVCRKP